MKFIFTIRKWDTTLNIIPIIQMKAMNKSCTFPEASDVSNGKTISDIIFILPGRKYPRIVIDDYEFNVHKKEANKTRWRCTNESKTKCTAVLYTFGNTVITRRSHNHIANKMENLSKIGLRKSVKVIRYD
ncbi:hypothetical protein JTB14_000792 [Gonioctena quinquepunctata]|nr:hypothetical protein JTB14_000792 [Gonioctena quinquepunctata]